MCKESNNNEVLNNDGYINYQTGEELDLERVSTLPDNALLKVNTHFWTELNLKKNNELNINFWKISYGSNKKIWWICPKCESNYESQAQSKSRGRSCPYCAGKRVNETNSLASRYPELINQWDFVKNGDITPDKISYGSEKVYWWYCDECDISYKSVVRNKVFSQGCPYCSSHRTNDINSLATLNPTLSSEWHPTKNGNLTPHDVTPNSHKKAWWLGECGHEWESIIKSRNCGHSCPYCSNKKVLKGYNDMWTTNPELASKLLNPEDGYKYTQGSGKRVNWKCLDCGEIVKDKKISDINIDGLSCRICSTGKSFPEKLMNGLLKQLNIDISNDISFHWLINKRYDFYIPSLNVIIETHGGQHYERGFKSAGGRTLEEEQANDQYKHEMAIHNGIKEYIVIDCRKSDMDFIKNNILNSRLAEVFDLSEIDWDGIELFATTSSIKLASQYWENGVRNTNEISKLLGISRTTAIDYLKRGNRVGLCTYNPKQRQLSIT